MRTFFIFSTASIILLIVSSVHLLAQELPPLSGLTASRTTILTKEKVHAELHLNQEQILEVTKLARESNMKQDEALQNLAPGESPKSVLRPFSEEIDQSLTKILGGVLTPLNGWHRDPLSHRPDVIGQTGRHRGRSSSPRSFAVAFP